MPGPLHHLHAARAALCALLDAGADAPRLAARIGLSAAAARGLQSVRQPARHQTIGPALVLQVEGDCPGSMLPRELRSPLDGSAIPVQALRCPGTAVAQTWVRAHNDSHKFLDGSLGAVLRLNAEPSRLLALTAGHVCGASVDSTRGDALRLEPQGGAMAAFDGVLLDWQPNFARLPGIVDIDAGIAEVDAEALADLATRLPDWPTGASMPFADDVLRLRTRGTEITGQGFEWLDARLSVAGDERLGFVLRNALCWRPAEPTQGGDSGAAVWNANDEVVAIHTGGQLVDGEALAYAVPIAPILRWAGASLVRRGESMARRALSVGLSVPLPATAPSPGRADQTALDVLARTVWGEARGEGASGMKAVGDVVFNRVRAKSWWGRDVIGVCHKPWQFSCWNANDPNRGALLRVSAADASFRLAFEIAQALSEAERLGTRIGQDDTQGATHYYAPARVARPRWATGLAPCARIGGHDFFKDVA